MAMQNTKQLDFFTIEGVVPLKKELGHGAYGRVFTVKYCGLVCAAKEIHPILIQSVNPEEKQAVKDLFMQECFQCSSIRHPNIVQFMGVYYSSQDADLPIMVMELMNASLTSYVKDNREKISLLIKVSVLHDISLGLNYLHSLKPPVVHRDLSPNNVMLTNQPVAKIGDLGVAKAIRADTRSKLTTAPGTLDFMPPETLEANPVYNTAVDVFSFAGITLHVCSEEWPTPVGTKGRDPVTKKLFIRSEAERRQQYLDKIVGIVALLKPLVKECLNDDPDERPPIQEVCEMTESLKTQLLESDTKSQLNQSFNVLSDAIPSLAVTASSSLLDFNGAQTSGVTFDEKMIQGNLKVTIAINGETMSFFIKDKYRGAFQMRLNEIRTSVVEKYLNLGSFRSINVIFENLAILIYNTAFAMEYKEFQQKIRELIYKAIATYEKGITIMEKLKIICFDAFKVYKGEMKQKDVKKKYDSIFSTDIPAIQLESINLHEHLTNLKRALDVYLEMETNKQIFGTVVIKDLMTAVECCIDGIETLSAACLRFLKAKKKFLSNDHHVEDVPDEIEYLTFLYNIADMSGLMIKQSSITIEIVKKELQRHPSRDEANHIVQTLSSHVNDMHKVFISARRCFRLPNL